MSYRIDNINNRNFNGYAKFTKAVPFETKVPIDISFIVSGESNQKINLPDIGETITLDEKTFTIMGYAIGESGIYAIVHDSDLDLTKWIEWDYNNSVFTDFWTAEITEYELLMHSLDGNTLDSAQFYIGLLVNEYVEAINSNWLNYSFLNTYSDVAW